MAEPESPEREPVYAEALRAVRDGRVPAGLPPRKHSRAQMDIKPDFSKNPPYRLTTTENGKNIADEAIPDPFVCHRLHARGWRAALRMLFHGSHIEDVTGVSGTGIVTWGVVFPDGVVALRWISAWPTSVVFHDRGMEGALKALDAPPC